MSQKRRSLFREWFGRLPFTRLRGAARAQATKRFRVPATASAPAYRGESLPAHLAYARRWKRAAAVIARKPRTRAVARAQRRIAQIERQW